MNPKLFSSHCPPHRLVLAAKEGQKKIPDDVENTFRYSIWRHGSASILGTTWTDTRAPMLMYWAGLSRIASSREKRSK